MLLRSVEGERTEVFEPNAANNLAQHHVTSHTKIPREFNSTHCDISTPRAIDPFAPPSDLSPSKSHLPGIAPAAQAKMGDLEIVDSRSVRNLIRLWECQC